MAELAVPDVAERDDLGAFVARVVRLDAGVVVRLKARGDLVDAWALTPFDALVTRTSRGSLAPADITVGGSDLLAGLTVVGTPVIDPGRARDVEWRSPLPPQQGWQQVDEVPVDVLAGITDRGIALARENTGPQGNPPASLLDQTVLTVSGEGFELPVPLRCLFALSGMGFVGDPTAQDAVRVWATDTWLRLDARYGAVVRRRHSLLPLLV